MSPLTPSELRPIKETPLDQEFYRAAISFDGVEEMRLIPMNADDLIAQALVVLKNRLHVPDFYMTDPKDAKTYLKLKFQGLEHEAFRVMFLDNKHGLIKEKELFRGTIGGASVYPREVVKAALLFNAAALVIAHNHPAGCPKPSEADRRITERLKSALALVDVRMIDHIVVGGDETYSFAEHGLL